jgi:hypothetical protein
MKYLAVMMTVCILAFSASASAQSLAEKEAMQSTDAAAAKSATEVQQACGNTAFSFKYDWPAYDTIDYSLAAQGPNTAKSTILEMAHMFSGDLATAMIKICSTDPTGKAEIAKLTGMNLTPRKDKSGGFGMHFAKDAASLNADYYPFARSGSQDLAVDLKKAL